MNNLKTLLLKKVLSGKSPREILAFHDENASTNLCFGDDRATLTTFELAFGEETTQSIFGHRADIPSTMYRELFQSVCDGECHGFDAGCSKMLGKVFYPGFSPRHYVYGPKWHHDTPLITASITIRKFYTSGTMILLLGDNEISLNNFSQAILERMALFQLEVSHQDETEVINVESNINALFANAVSAKYSYLLIGEDTRVVEDIDLKGKKNFPSIINALMREILKQANEHSNRTEFQLEFMEDFGEDGVHTLIEIFVDKYRFMDDGSILMSIEKLAEHVQKLYRPDIGPEDMLKLGKSIKDCEHWRYILDLEKGLYGAPGDVKGREIMIHGCKLEKDVVLNVLDSHYDRTSLSGVKSGFNNLITKTAKSENAVKDLNVQIGNNFYNFFGDGQTKKTHELVVKSFKIEGKYYTTDETCDFRSMLAAEIKMDCNFSFVIEGDVFQKGEKTHTFVYKCQVLMMRQV